MIKYIFKRVLLLFVTLFGITMLTFLITRLTPGDPAEMKAGPQGGASRAQAGFEDIVEQNRRNLGLDKPWLINTNFEDRYFLADRALDDFLREEKMWQDIGKKSLSRVNTIAVERMLARYDALEAGKAPVPKDRKGKPVKMLPAEAQKERLVEHLPQFAQEAELAKGLKGGEAIAFWKKWWEENKGRFEEKAIERSLNEFFAGTKTVADMRKLGGYAVPGLMEALRDGTRAEKANEALSAITGFTFLRKDWKSEKATVIVRWESFFRRDETRYVTFGPVRHGLNILMNTQFGIWCSQVARFDFGDSYRQARPVTEMVLERLPTSLQISIPAILMGYLLAIPIGIFSAVKRYSAADRVITVILFALYSLPAFWVASMLLMTTTGGGNWPDLFPSRGLNEPGKEFGTPGVTWGESMLDRIHHLVLPVLVLTYGSIAFVSRQMRGAVLETIKQDYTRTAQAKGLSELTVIFKHVVRNSLIPIITISAGILPELIAGAIITESIFDIRGMGLLTFESILNRDYPVINAILFFSAFLTLLGILLADLMYAVVDPRISYE